ncbi:MAG: Bug family tripartite tricarboxylate transporter substrate binding protein [Limnohabitans sp.]|jgi:tripartite-type tricarboxylate transporter receptor subunit TctC|nr:tripartite tricarboxylate transporter substrate binding protein [Betaproteobacteria bacterium]NCW40931.1 tripartite tricarboxylate transporter substrate binding protein [Betaproteobacteria bacterium]
MKRRTLIAATAATLAVPMVRAQSLPKGPVRIIVGFPPGGGTDALARVVAQKLQAMWGLSIVIENKAGAAGVIAADFVSKQAPDGNTLLMAHINSHALAPAMGTRLNYDAERDFAPISMVGVTPNILICNADQPAKTVADLVELCKRQPGKISFASAGGGSAQHFALEMFKLQAGIDALHVPYKGSGPALTDLIGGQVNYCFETMTSATPHIKSGKAIALAQTRLKRAKGFPGVPTMAESGFAGYEATVWYGLMAPARMPPGMTQRMNEDVNKVLAMPDVQEKMDQYGAEDGGGSIEKFASFIKNEQQKWAQVAKAANVKIDN